MWKGSSRKREKYMLKIVRRPAETRLEPNMKKQTVINSK